MKYEITRQIETVIMTRLQYNNLRGWKLPSDERGDDDGYMITDLNTKHISWLPKSEFILLNKKELI